MSDLELEKPLGRGEGGSQVKLVQEWLSLHNEHVAIDGDFGPATHAAVKAFQERSGCEATGVVDAATFGLLVAPMTAALAPIAVDSGPLGALVVAYAQQHLAQHPREIGGQNRGPWVRLYMKGNEGEQWAWCAGFACFVLDQACRTLSMSSPIQPSFSCDAVAASAHAVGRLVAASEAGTGSFFLVHSAPADWTHVGIVVAKSDETFATIEGNTNDDGGREGYEVCARTRGYRNMDFVRV